MDLSKSRELSIEVITLKEGKHEKHNVFETGSAIPVWREWFSYGQCECGFHHAAIVPF
jgi:hypothetical protein